MNIYKVKFRITFMCLVIQSLAIVLLLVGGCAGTGRYVNVIEANIVATAKAAEVNDTLYNIEYDHYFLNEIWKCAEPVMIALKRYDIDNDCGNSNADVNSFACTVKKSMETRNAALKKEIGKKWVNRSREGQSGKVTQDQWTVEANKNASDKFKNCLLNARADKFLLSINDNCKQSMPLLKLRCGVSFAKKNTTALNYQLDIIDKQATIGGGTYDNVDDESIVIDAYNGLADTVQPMTVSYQPSLFQRFKSWLVK